MATIIYGLTTTGLVIKSLSVIRADLETAFRQAFGVSIPLGDLTLLGQIIGILAERYAELWSLVQAIYAAGDPDSATGTSLEVLSSFTGTFKLPASSSLATLTLTGTPLTVIPSTTQFKTVSTGAVFASTLDVTLVAADAWVTATLYAAGARVTNSGNLYQCTVGGTSGAGPTATSNPVPTDGTVTWLFVGVGTGVIDVPATAILTGPTQALAGDLTSIVNPIGGLTGAYNISDATVGRDVQTDQGLRLTRNAELTQGGSGSPDAIRAAILLVTGVTACTVYANNTDSFDGITFAHSVLVLVQGGADQDIANSLFAHVSAGIATNGNTPVSVTDSQGTVHTVTFSRVTLVNVSVDITLTYNPASVALGGYAGDAAVAAAVAIFGNAQAAGHDVVASSISASAFPLFYNNAQVGGVQGVLDVTSVKISSAASPAIPPAPTVSTTIALSTFQQAVYDSSRVFVHSSPGSV